MSPSEPPPIVAKPESVKPVDSKDKEEASMKKLDHVFKWGLILCTGQLVYGHFMVAFNLPKDKRQDDWLLMQSPIPTYVASALYVICVTWLGPMLMKNRKPFSGLRNLMVLYNAIQVIYSFYLFWEAGMGGWFGSYSYVCQACDFSDEPQAIRMMHGNYWYYFSKFVDFLDTVFFVLHKKYDHISLLHVGHHALMPVSMWYGVRHQPGGHNSFMILLNSLVHTVMYLYYCLAAMGPSVRPYLWWKKYLTSMQLIQFTFVILHSAQLAFVDCPDVHPRVTQWVAGNALIFLVLFADFYMKSYSKKPQNKSKANGVSSVPTENGIGSSYTNGISLSISSSVSRRRGIPNGVADTACKTIEMCETMAFRTPRGAAI